MIAAYNGLREKNENFEMVMVAKMANATMEAVGGGDAEAAFNHFFDAFPCLAIPFWDPESRDFLCRSLGLTNPWSHCAALVLDPDQVVLQTDGSCFYTHGASGFPYTDDRLKAVDPERTETLDFLFNNQPDQVDSILIPENSGKGKAVEELNGVGEVDSLLIPEDGGKGKAVEGLNGVDDFETRMSLTTALFDRLRLVKLETLLPRPCLNNYGVSVPVSQLKGRNVLLYLDSCMNVCQGHGRLYKKLCSYHVDISNDSEIVFASVNCDCVDWHPWLVYSPPGGVGIVEQLFPVLTDRGLP